MTIFLAPDQIVIPPNRHRSDPSITHIQRLETSIRNSGLINPVVVHHEGDKYELVAGLHRLAALNNILELEGEYIFLGETRTAIACNAVSDLSTLEREEIEFEENDAREALTWQQKALATERIFNLKRRIAEEKGLPEPTMATIAEEIFKTETNVTGSQQVSRDLLVARNIDNPIIKGAKTREEAVKLLKREEELRQHAVIFKNLGPSTNSHYITTQGNCLEILPTLETGAFDGICTDPPYGIGADSFGNSGRTDSASHTYQDTPGALRIIIDTLPPHLYRVTKPDAFCYIFCDFEGFTHWSTSMTKAGWKVFRTPLIWHKPQGFRAPWPNKGPQRQYECVLYAVKGEQSCNMMKGDVLTHGADANMNHNAQKPVALLVDLLSRSVTPGQKILDPFCGSGSIFPAAKKLGLLAHGIELEDMYLGMCIDRITQMQKGGE